MKDRIIGEAGVTTIAARVLIAASGRPLILAGPPATCQPAEQPAPRVMRLNERGQTLEQEYEHKAAAQSKRDRKNAARAARSQQALPA